MSDAAVIEQGPSAGTLLRRAREAAGLHVAALAVALKVPVRKIEALEEDRYDELPDAVFARALASSVCRTLKIDPQPVLERLPQRNPPPLASEREPINAPFRAPGDAAPATWRNRLTRPVSLVVIALLFAALVLVFLPTMHRDDAAAVAPGAVPPPAAQPAIVNEPVAVPGAQQAVAPGAATAAPGPDAAGAAPASPAGAEPASAPVAAAPAAAASTAAQPAVEGAAPAGATLVFKTTGQSWVEVTDARGAVALRRLMRAGETAGASGTHPLAVTVGNARDTSVQVRGKSYDLAPVSKDNVARFEVK